MLVLILLTILAAPALSQTHTAHHSGQTNAIPLDTAPRLGTITFPTSGAPAAQENFLRGVLYLHSFEYDAAAESFRAAQEKDPGFVMAYWGEAMTHTHPIWNEQDLSAARGALSRLGPTSEARVARAGTARERAWLGAVEVLYGEGSKARRDTLYEAAMASLAADYPDDEATTFHALAIMGLSQGVRNVDAYMRAGALALPVFERNADHPGAAHYVIHAFDDPTHATRGLDAARAYAGIAPGAAHAQHMTTHIFLALGMWPEVISQNIVASGPDRSKWQAGHYTYWLHYGLLQAGRVDEAAALLDTLRAHAGASAAAGRRAILALSRAQQVITGERWNDPALYWTLELGDIGPATRAADGFALGFAAMKRGDLADAAAIATAMRVLPGGAGPASVPVLIARELEASLVRARGDKAEAERLLRAVIAEAGALPVEFGPPDFVKPPLELLAEWLREDGRVDEARRAYEAAAAVTPGRLLLLRDGK
jgi:tetratricopeptide (TPR) repeat protein